MLKLQSKSKTSSVVDIQLAVSIIELLEPLYTMFLYTLCCSLSWKYVYMQLNDNRISENITATGLHVLLQH